jgi:predicted acylesterase/phospholipase RssA
MISYPVMPQPGRPALVLALCLLLTRPSFLLGQSCHSPRTALVLSGGGAKGLAHVGVLRVLDSLGIRPDLIVGTSMGAAVGALYASGYSGRELDSLARVAPLAQLFRPYQPRAPRSLGVLQPLVLWEQGEHHFNLQSAAIVESEVNALVNAALLRGNLLARGNFDSLPIPFRAVATDLADRTPVVMASGDLAQAVRASIAVPLLFDPELRDGRYLVDGGLSANLPVAIARAAGVERVIVSDATDHLPPEFDAYSPLLVADRLVRFLFLQVSDSLTSADVLVRPDVDRFTSLNFSHGNIARLLELGRKAADAALGPPACHAEPPSARGLPTRIAGFRVPEGNHSERVALGRLLGFGLSDSLDPSLLRSRLRNFGVASEDYRAVWLSPRGKGDSVEFDLTLRRAARRVAGLGLVYDNELGGRMWAGAVDRRLFGLALEGSGALFLGELRKEVYAGVRRNYQVGRQLIEPTLTARLATEHVRQFDASGDELEEADIREALGFVGAERALPNGWEAGAGLVAHVWDEPVRADLSTAGATLRVERATADRGHEARAEITWTGVYQRAALEAEPSVRLGVVRLVPRLRLGWGEDLPIHLQLPLGGEDGFPGLHIGERRGSREVMLGAAFSTPVMGPVLARMELAAGRTAEDGPLLGDDGWVGGARVGLGADTPVGPVRFEYGYSTEERGAVYVRLGRWF